jgi:hypothetical protein
MATKKATKVAAEKMYFSGYGGDPGVQTYSTIEDLVRCCDEENEVDVYEAVKVGTYKLTTSVVKVK